MSKMPELLPYAVRCISTVKISLNIIVVSCETLSGRTGVYPDDNLIIIFFFFLNCRQHTLLQTYY